ncbi:MAG: valine--tRNA ligase [Candidatus Komeilibacteria bacterium]|jgi:valyl-tRNA synthetase|nr:valine--tRNA ligase [Candidatus Komeilibacteria bacterium]MBT4447508.1 valine--tRNA ligase [Candidatus Komeilibacteria bacterium]
MAKKLEEMDKAYEPSKYEDDIYKIWEESGFFNPDNLDTKGKAFTISMPPPNATGILHLGHAAALAYEDLMIRYRRLKGDKTLWVPGTDHAAIATQTKVEKILAEEGTNRQKLGRDKFLTRVKEFVAGSQNTIRNQTRKMGASCDWSRERYTFDDGLSQAVNEAFVRMYNDGLIEKDYRIVNWCPRCESTLADDEVEHQEQDAKLYYIKYGPFVVATTRPETKLADTGVAVNPSDKRYKEYVGQTLDVDLAGHQIKVKIFADKELDKDFGSGVVGVTPAHSATDYDFAQRHSLEVIKLINEQGIIMKTGGKYEGKTVLEAREVFVKDLEAADQIDKVEDFKNNLSICYRCDTAIEPLTSDQWFVRVNKEIPGRGKSLKTLATLAVKDGDIKILPEKFNKIYYHWMDNLHDWCISRQIWWGHRIPVWYTEDNEVIVAQNEAEAQEKANGKKLRQDEDTLDTWFSSSLWTFSTLGWPEQTEDLKNFHPTGVMETGYDILFFWVARMILMTEYILKDKPFETVYLHGMIRDKEGKKMSKSLGNGINPLEMIDNFGTDALRLSLIIGSAPGADMRLYEEKIAGYRNFVNKLWNISRFIFSNVDEIKRIDKQPKAKTLADRWILAKFNQVNQRVTEHLDNHKFSEAGVELYHFTWGDFADWYLEIAKIEKDKDEILLYILERLLILYHPFTPFVTEVIWKQFNNDKLLMIEKWPDSAKFEDSVISDFSELKELVVALRNLKAANKISPTEFPDCFIASKVLEKDYLELAAKMARVNLVDKKINVEAKLINSSTVYVDLSKELSDKEKQDLKKYIISTEAKLTNNEFINNAPAKVIEDTKKRLAEVKNKLK